MSAAGKQPEIREIYATHENSDKQTREREGWSGELDQDENKGDGDVRAARLGKRGGRIERKRKKGIEDFSNAVTGTSQQDSRADEANQKRSGKILSRAENGS